MASEKKRGGSDSAREKKLTGVVMHFTQEERHLIGLAAATAGVRQVKAFCTAAVLAEARKILKKEDSGID